MLTCISITPLNGDGSFHVTILSDDADTQQFSFSTGAKLKKFLNHAIGVVEEELMEKFKAEAEEE